MTALFWRSVSVLTSEANKQELMKKWLNKISEMFESDGSDQSINNQCVLSQWAGLVQPPSAGLTCRSKPPVLTRVRLSVMWQEAGGGAYWSTTTGSNICIRFVFKYEAMTRKLLRKSPDWLCQTARLPVSSRSKVTTKIKVFIWRETKITILLLLFLLLWEDEQCDMFQSEPGS